VCSFPDLPTDISVLDHKRYPCVHARPGCLRKLLDLSGCAAGVVFDRVVYPLTGLVYLGFVIQIQAHCVFIRPVVSGLSLCAREDATVHHDCNVWHNSLLRDV